jgi:hypothetical protein
MKLSTKCAVLAIAAVVAGATNAQAQNTDTNEIDVLAEVATAITVSPVQDLDLGDVFPGTTTTVTADHGSSGEFLITGGADGGVDITMTLPATLTSGANSMPITFTAAAGADRGSAAGFDPAALYQGRLAASNGELRVFLGAQVNVPAAQPAGSYSGVVQLTATYNGL